MNAEVRPCWAHNEKADTMVSAWVLHGRMAGAYRE